MLCCVLFSFLFFPRQQVVSSWQRSSPPFCRQLGGGWGAGPEGDAEPGVGTRGPEAAVRQADLEQRPPRERGKEPSGEYSQFASNKLPVSFLFLCCHPAGRGSRVSSSISRALPCSLFPPSFFFSLFFFFSLLYAQGDLEVKILGDLDFFDQLGSSCRCCLVGVLSQESVPACR